MAGFAARSALAKIQDKYNRAMGHAARAKEKATEVMGVTLCAVETTGAAAGLSYANARFGKPDAATGINVLTVPGTAVPVDLVAGAALHIGAFLGVFSGYGEHAHSLGNGALASYGSRLGAEMGAKAALKTQGLEFTGLQQMTGMQQIMTGALPGASKSSLRPFVQTYNEKGVPVGVPR